MGKTDRLVVLTAGFIKKHLVFEAVEEQKEEASKATGVFHINPFAENVMRVNCARHAARETGLQALRAAV